MPRADYQISNNFPSFVKKQTKRVETFFCIYCAAGIADKPSYQEYHRFDLVNANKTKATREQKIPFKWHLKDHLTSASKSYTGVHYQKNAAPAAAVSPVASISLPAISNSAVGAAVVARKDNTQQHDRSSIRDKISPHLVLGNVHKV